ncbi:hypothetical protein T440DRAFT_533383 [Plenodomus tracheiphilus IPT5]|uniref:Uncharacterized protein n=1 Tax=Plenodomus tracheiphilus IPT5 TaxID=1408161 RepID=A0A6A7B5Z8_9PLEO|nr:hypothetical protein T440DRAFT_533383 [Plenodomus tracheiphilus IPT5]
MPALQFHQLQPRFTTNGGSGNISATAIGLLIGVGLIPVIILIWVVCWLLFAYPHGRNICCCVRKRKTNTHPPPQMVQRGSSDTSQETLYEEAGVTMPKRPYAVHSRTESGSSSGTGRLKKEREREGRLEWQRREMRMSGVSERSGETVVVVQEPKRFV